MITIVERDESIGLGRVKVEVDGQKVWGNWRKIFIDKRGKYITVKGVKHYLDDIAQQNAGHY
jgi:hypothetical protein